MQAASGLRVAGAPGHARGAGRGRERHTPGLAAALSLPRGLPRHRQQHRHRGSVVVVRAGPDSGSEPSQESLFMKELKKRGLADGGEAGTQESAEERLNRAAGKAPPRDPFGGSKGGGSDPPPFENPQMTEDQLKRSRALQSEGLEGLIPRATELVKTGFFGGFIAFLPIIGAASLLFTACALLLGTDFIHGGRPEDSPYGGSSGPPAYVDPDVLLNEPTYDRTVPMSSARGPMAPAPAANAPPANAPVTAPATGYVDPDELLRSLEE